MGGKLEKQGKFENQPSENVMKMPMLWVLHMTQSTSAGEKGKEIFEHVYKDNLFHTELDCNMHTIVFKGVLHSISVTERFFD